MNMSCTLGKLFGRASATLSTLANVGTMALEELPALTGSSAKRFLVSTLNRTGTVLPDIRRCVSSTIPSKIFEAERNSRNNACLRVLSEGYEGCKTDAGNNERFLTGVLRASSRDFAEQLGGLVRELSSCWNETHKLANASHREAASVHEGTPEELESEEGSGASSSDCEEPSFSKLTEGVSDIHLGCGGSEDEPFKAFDDSVTDIMEPVLTSAMRAREMAAKLKAHQAEAEAVRKDHECVPLFRQFLNTFPSW
ncbi:hypothetical protein TRVL_04671 [Trypanosoma vivax]|nr:hypothetical protein TRVL_04671 [Trypanosoma vivax]